jgi:hypothetical protein
VGYDVLAALCMMAVTPFVICGFVLFWRMNARDHDELAASWRSYARKRGFDFVEPAGEWPNRTAPIVTWKDDGTTYRLCAIGREAQVRTRLVIRPRAALLGTLALSIDEHGAGRLHVREHPAAFRQRVVSDGVHRFLLELRQRDRVSLSYRRGLITIEWPGGEQNELRIDAAVKAGAEAVSTVASEFRRGLATTQRPAA